MIIIRLKGGLGNQAYQYAAAKSLALRKNKKLYLDLSYLLMDRLRDYCLDVFPNINETEIILTKEISKKLTRIKKVFLAANGKPANKTSTYYYLEKKLQFTELDYIDEDIVYLDGYFQGEKYYLDIKDKILHDFYLPEKRESKNAQLLNDIKNTESISIHFRRGDYISDPQVRKDMDNICTFDYYQKAINHIQSATAKRLHFFVFSDEIDWVKKNFIMPPKFNVIYVESYPEFGEATDMWLMSKCKHNIVANSTYSWWGAWLNTNKNKIVCAPSKWHIDRVSDDDLIPERWIKI